MDIQWVYGINLKMKKGEKMKNKCKCPLGNEFANENDCENYSSSYNYDCFGNEND